MRKRIFLLVTGACTIISALAVIAWDLFSFYLIEVGLPFAAFGVAWSVVNERKKMGVACAYLAIVIETFSLILRMTSYRSIDFVSVLTILVPIFAFNIIYAIAFDKLKIKILLIVASTYAVAWRMIIPFVLGYVFSTGEFVYYVRYIFLLVMYAIIAGQDISIKNKHEGTKMGIQAVKSKMVAILLSVFLGGLGVDRFYLGYIGMGILKLLTVGCFGILYIYDIIVICAGKLKPADGLGYEEDINTVSSLQSQNTEENMMALEKLAKLHDQGILTDEEFSRKKGELLSKI